jgi:hypothetical protein
MKGRCRHRMTAANTYAGKDGSRRCRKCGAAYARERRRRLKAAQPPAKVSLTVAARTLRVSLPELRARAREGAVRVEQRSTGRARWLFDLDELREDLAALRCAGPGCNRRTKGSAAFCSHRCSVAWYWHSRST